MEYTEPEETETKSYSTSVTQRDKDTVVRVSDFKKLNSMLTKAVATVPKNGTSETIRSLGRNLVETRCESQYNRNLTKVTSTSSGIAIMKKRKPRWRKDTFWLLKNLQQSLSTWRRFFGIKKLKDTVRTSWTTQQEPLHSISMEDFTSISFTLRVALQGQRFF